MRVSVALNVFFFLGILVRIRSYVKRKKFVILA